MSKDFSDEHLNAFIDDEIDINEKQHVLDAFQHDEALRKRGCELQKVHDLVEMTYQAVEPPEKYQNKRLNKPRPWLLRSLAAGFFIVFGTLVGWFSHQQVSPQNGLIDLAKAVQPASGEMQSDNMKLMLHVSTNDPYRLNILLEETEYLLKANQESGRKLLVEILTNGPGLDLVNNKGSSQAKRLHSLQEQYENLVVSACAQALERVRQEKGVELELIPNTRVVRSSLGEVIKRQEEGWTYIRI